MYRYFVSYTVNFGNAPGQNFGNLIFDVEKPIEDAGGITQIQQQLQSTIQTQVTGASGVSVVLLNISLLKQEDAPQAASEETAQETASEA